MKELKLKCVDDSLAVAKSCTDVVIELREFKKNMGQFNFGQKKLKLKVRGEYKYHSNPYICRVLLHLVIPSLYALYTYMCTCTSAIKKGTTIAIFIKNAFYTHDSSKP